MADASLHTLLWWPVATWINCFSSWWWLLAVIIIICIYKNIFHLRISKCFCAHLIKLHNILWGKCQECCCIHFYAGFSKKTRSVSNLTDIWFTSRLHRTEQLTELQELRVLIWVTLHLPHSSCCCHAMWTHALSHHKHSQSNLSPDFQSEMALSFPGALQQQKSLGKKNR